MFLDDLSMSSSSNYDVIIAGGGPAGSSTAIHLALRDARVLLIEQKKFPRAKLCGEFISPECAFHFERLGVAEQMFAAGPATLTETVFYARSGARAVVPSSWFGSSGVALGLSRAEMDERLLRRAAAAGVHVTENASVSNLIVENGCVRGVIVRHETTETSYRAPITVDATGRSRALTRQLVSRTKNPKRAPMIAFKAHLENTGVEPGACEIYFYRGGYGGLSTIERGLSNLCFIASAGDVRACDADANRVMREIVGQNRRARRTLEKARLRSNWMAVSLEGFGRYRVAPAGGLLAVGDAASFIDPFTGSGMLMAMESGELAANAIGEFLESPDQALALDHLNARYSAAYEHSFDSRLKLCSLMRKAAFIPGVAELAVRLFRASDYVRRRTARATRGSAGETYSLATRVR